MEIEQQKLTEYAWWGCDNEPPNNLKTRTQLEELDLKPVNPVGVIHCKKYTVKLYDINNSESVRQKKILTESCKKSLEKAQKISRLIGELRDWDNLHREAEFAYNDALYACKKIWENKSAYVVLDIETTGFSCEDEIIEIAIVSLDGTKLLNSLVRPKCRISEEAQNIHGISQEMLKDAPTFLELYPKLKAAIQGKQICIYNKDFDIGMLRYCEKINGLPRVKYRIFSICIMELYAQYYNEWSEYWEDWKWQPLNGGHRALGDCLATIELIKEMAEAEYETPPQAYFELLESGTKAKTAQLFMSLVRNCCPQLRES
ncbi:MAG: 3'-5' exonuclease [Cyclobacteriaceae bacterium]